MLSEDKRAEGREESIDEPSASQSHINHPRRRRRRRKGVVWYDTVTGKSLLPVYLNMNESHGRRKIESSKQRVTFIYFSMETL